MWASMQQCGSSSTNGIIPKKKQPRTFTNIVSVQSTGLHQFHSGFLAFNWDWIGCFNITGDIGTIFEPDGWKENDKGTTSYSVSYRVLNWADFSPNLDARYVDSTTTVISQTSTTTRISKFAPSHKPKQNAKSTYHTTIVVTHTPNQFGTPTRNIFHANAKESATTDGNCDKLYSLLTNVSWGLCFCSLLLPKWSNNVRIDGKGDSCKGENSCLHLGVVSLMCVL